MSRGVRRGRPLDQPLLGTDAKKDWTLVDVWGNWDVPMFIFFHFHTVFVENLAK